MAVRTFVDKQGNTRYIIDYLPNGRKGRRVVFRLAVGATEELVRQYERDLRSRKKQTPKINPSSSISRLIPRYIEYCYLHQSPETSKDKQSHFKTHLAPFFGHWHVSELTNAHVTAYKQHMRKASYRGKPISNRTISKGLNYFSAFLKWCNDEVDLRTPLPIQFRKLPHARPVPVVLSLDEAMRFILSADNICRYAYRCPGNPKCTFKIPYNVMFKIYFYLGLRNRAVRRLKWVDADWTKHAIKTTEKGNKTKWHPLPDDLFEELRGLYILSASEYMFPSPRDLKKPVNNILKGVARARKRALIEKRVYPHLLRHSIATHLVDSDVDIRQIQAFLGHSHISTTEWYAHVSLEKKRQALEKAGIKTTKML